MTVEEIKEFLRDYDIEPTADMIDAIEEIYRDGFGDGHDEGYEQGRVDALIQGN